MNLFELFVKVCADDQASKPIEKIGKTSQNLSKEVEAVSKTVVNKVAVMTASYAAASKEVDELAKELDKSIEATGAASKETQELADKLYKAEAAAENAKKRLNKYQAEIEAAKSTTEEVTEKTEDLGDEVEEAGEKAEKSGNKFSDFSSKLGKGLATAAKIGAAAVGAAATAVAALTKSAVENYAEYEQLVGGVETLFGDAADTVVQYADEAYKSAGLSANEYMDTVTSFSASLLQSLGLGAQTNLEELEETLDAEYEATKQTYEDEYDALKASWAAKIALAKKEKRNNLAELEAQRDEELKSLQRTQDESLAILKKSNAAKLAEAEKANNASEVTAETQELAAEKANLAVIDMADNANKMGTDIASIQNAYQGFAKQNYTMLDNLKLGYGGTKEEMERLLQDASALSGIEYDISSFADIVDAIHVVQTEMGITGTTAEEASTTIQGSISSMKSAWTNLLTGMSDENADMDTLITNFVDSLGTVAKNIVPKVSTALNSISRLVGRLLPAIVKEIPKLIQQNLPVLVNAAVSIVQSLVDGISENQDMIFDVVVDTVVYLADSFIAMLPQIVELGLDLIVSLANGIADSLPELVPTIVDVVLQICETLTDPETLVGLVDAALEIVLALADGLIDALPQLIEKAPEIIGGLVEGLLESIPKITDAAIELVFGLIAGLNIPESIQALMDGGMELAASVVKGMFKYNFVSVGANIFKDIEDGFMEFIANPMEWGKDLIDNFIAGIDGRLNKLKETASDVAGSIKDFLGFSEPKKGPLSNFHTYAPDMMDLFAQGIKDNESVITNQIEKSFDFGERTIGFGAEHSGAVGSTVATGTNLGGVTININGAKYSDEQSLAEAIAEALQNMTDRKAAVYA